VHARRSGGGQGGGQRRVPVQVLVAEAPLVREAEQADETSGAATVRELAELSGAGCPFGRRARGKKWSRRGVA